MMDEKLKHRREVIFKVLAWGTFVYLIVVGYSINQSGLFEFQSDEKRKLRDEQALDSTKRERLVFKELDDVKLKRANQLEEQAANAEPTPTPNAPARVAENNLGETKPPDPSKLRVEAAQLRMDVYLSREERDDGRDRAAGLMFGALAYSLLYPFVVWKVYTRTDPGEELKEKDVFTVRMALVYAIGMGFLTCIVAFMTALR